MPEQPVAPTPTQAIEAVLSQDFMRPDSKEYIRHIRVAFSQEPEWFRENDSGQYGTLIPLNTYELRLRLITSLRLMGFTQQQLIKAVRALVQAGRWKVDDAERLERKNRYRFSVSGDESTRNPARH